MPEYDYQRSLTFDSNPDELFGFLSKIENLPKYLPRVSQASPEGGDEVHLTATLPPQMTGDGVVTKVETDEEFSVDADHRSISWDSDVDREYRGELQVTPEGSGAKLTITLHTPFSDDAINDGIDETLQNVKGLVDSSPR